MVDFSKAGPWRDVDPVALKMSQGDVLIGTYVGGNRFANDFGDGVFLEFSDVTVIRNDDRKDEAYEAAGMVATKALLSRMRRIREGCKCRIEEVEPMPATRKGYDPLRMFKVQVARADERPLPPQEHGDDIPF